MPTSEHSFLKLPIKESYTLQGQAFRPVLDGVQINAAWAIVACAPELTEYCPWIAKIFREIATTYGSNIFHAQANPKAQLLALNDILCKTAFEHEWAYVIEEEAGTDTVFLGSNGHVSFPDALYAELTFQVFQLPESIRLSQPAKFVVVCDYRGNRKLREPIDKCLRGPVLEATQSETSRGQEWQTEIAIPTQSSQHRTIETLLEELDALIGLQPVKREVRSLINYLRVQRLRVEQGLPAGKMALHLVFTGNPGTGKTTVARLLSEIYRAVGLLPQGHLVETDRSGLVAGFVGQTALKTSEVVSRALGGVLFIDEAYALARNRNGEGDAFGTEAIDTLLKLMEDNRDELVVIVAGYSAPMEQFLESNPGMRSRFTRYFHFEDYSPVEMFRIFESMAIGAGYNLSDDARVKVTQLFKTAYEQRDTSFGNARLARTVFEEACVRLSDRLGSDVAITREELTIIQANDVREPALPL
jgi:Holliday junction resolvasome RuvABC ATP-dependent DNA helicase subunit